MFVLLATRSRPVEIVLLVGYLVTVAAFGMVVRERRRGQTHALVPAGRGRSAAELQGVPGRNGSELEQRPTAPGVAVGEVGRGIVPRDLEQALLDAVVQPRAPEHQLPDPVDERLAVDDREPLPVADEIHAESAARLVDAPVGRELDEIRGLVHVELVAWDETEPDDRSRDALLEVEGAERELVAQELDDVVVAGGVVGLGHERENSPQLQATHGTAKRLALSVVAASVVILAAAAVVRVPASMAPLLAPVVLALLGSLLALLAIRSRDRSASREP
jgi:hypothetical protein